MQRPRKFNIITVLMKLHKGILIDVQVLKFYPQYKNVIFF